MKVHVRGDWQRYFWNMINYNRFQFILFYSHGLELENGSCIFYSGLLGLSNSLVKFLLIEIKMEKGECSEWNC